MTLSIVGVREGFYIPEYDKPFLTVLSTLSRFGKKKTPRAGENTTEGRGGDFNFWPLRRLENS